MVEGRVIENDIDLNKIVDHLARHAHEGMGAIVIFIGFVKGDIDGKKVSRLDYSVYEPYTSKKLEEIASEEMEEGIYDIKIFHKYGNLDVGDKTLYIIVGAKGRKKGFEKAIKVLERVKFEPPIFKLEHREDGEYWVFGDGTRLKRESRDVR